MNDGSQPLVLVACRDLALRGRIVAALAAASISATLEGFGPADAAVLTFDLSDSRGIRELRAAVHGLSAREITIVSPDAGPLGVRRALREGVAGIVFEDELEVALAPAVRAVAAGLSAVPVRLRTEADKLCLSRREVDVLRLVTAGRTNHEIAAELYLAESTVKTHLRSLFRKVGADSRNELARLARDPDESLSHLLDPALYSPGRNERFRMGETLSSEIHPRSRNLRKN